jgi:hypothetical protein
MKQMNDEPKNIQLCLIAPNKNFIAPNERNILLVAMPHRAQ